MILDNMKSPTIERALELVDKQADTLETWRTKGLGLRFVLLGLAEIQALRLSRLAGMVVQLEEILLDANMIKMLEPKMVFALYNLANKSLTESSDFIERTLKSISWDDIETGLLQVKALETTKSSSGLSSEDSQDLLNLISQLKFEHDRNGSNGNVIKALT